MNFKLTDSVLIFIIITIIVCLPNCRTPQYTEHWNNQSKTDSLIINPEVKGAVNFLIRGDEDALDERIINDLRYSIKHKKSSTINMVILNDKRNYIQTIDRLLCTAVIKNDTVIIKNGISLTDAGYGIELKFSGNKINTSYYRYFESGVPHHEIFKSKILKQNIYLDKAKYLPGDSLFGSIYTKMIDENKTKYYITGYFRTKVKDKQY